MASRAATKARIVATTMPLVVRIQSQIFFVVAYNGPRHPGCVDGLTCSYNRWGTPVCK